MKSVAQVQRGTFVNNMSSGNAGKHIYDSFKSMLPRAFKSIDYNDTSSSFAVKRFSKNDEIELTPAEKSVLSRLIQNNQYAAVAAQQAGIARRENGFFYIKDKIARGSVNAMGGYIIPDFVRAAKGMEMYGIKDVDNPDNWRQIARKGSKRF